MIEVVKVIADDVGGFCISDIQNDEILKDCFLRQYKKLVWLIDDMGQYAVLFRHLFKMMLYAEVYRNEGKLIDFKGIFLGDDVVFVDLMNEYALSELDEEQIFFLGGLLLGAMPVDVQNAIVFELHSYYVDVMSKNLERDEHEIADLC